MFFSNTNFITKTHYMLILFKRFIHIQCLQTSPFLYERRYQQVAECMCMYSEKNYRNILDKIDIIN